MLLEISTTEAVSESSTYCPLVFIKVTVYKTHMLLEISTTVAASESSSCCPLVIIKLDLRLLLTKGD